MERIPRLMPGKYFHIYNRGHNSGEIFIEEENYRHFLRLYAKYIVPVADTFAYCLMRNHFHLLVRIKDLDGHLGIMRAPRATGDHQGLGQRNPTQAFSNLFNAYAKALNKRYRRTGEVFEKRFHRIEVISDEYFGRLLFYIHFNPQKHKVVPDYRMYQYSSYNALAGNSRTNLARSEVLQWFGSRNEFISFHSTMVSEKQMPQIDRTEDQQSQDVS
jgi:REP element-mobilizing transposase RayT